MPNTLDTNGLQVATQAELKTNMDAALKAAYGPDIDLDSDTPDGQWENINIQAALDVEDLITNVYDMMDPDQAVGVVLDQRVALNGIQRQGGTFTVTNITVVISQSLNLYGSDQNVNAVFTVADAAGNQYQLITTQVGLTAGTYVFAFQAVNPGAVVSLPNTITIPVTIVIGVTSVNNPTTYTTLGVTEESDQALRLRRQQAVTMPSQGWANALQAALLNIPGVTYAKVWENTTSATVNGIPGHSVWVVVGGNGSAALIANAIYTYRSTGCGMTGAISYSIIQADGSTFPVYWSTIATETLYVKFTVTSLDGVTPPNVSAIRTQLPTTFVPGIDQQVNTTALGTAVQSIDPNSYISNAGFSTSATGPFTSTLSPTALNYQFTLVSADVIVLPMQLLPLTSTIVHATTQTFTALGGFGTYTYSISVNNSGGSINGSSGLYTAGASTGVQDTILVTDGQGNTATAVVNVI